MNRRNLFKLAAAAFGVKLLKDDARGGILVPKEIERHVMRTRRLYGEITKNGDFTVHNGRVRVIFD